MQAVHSLFCPTTIAYSRKTSCCPQISNVFKKSAPTASVMHKHEPRNCQMEFKRRPNILMFIFLFLSRNRVAVQLQKNLDRQRLKRIGHKISSGSRTGGYLGPLPGEILDNNMVRKTKESTPATDSSEFDDYDQSY